MTASPPTRWTLVEQAKGCDPAARQALADLCAIYHAPIAAQMRRWLGGADDAADVTQAFFAHLLAGNQLDGADAGKGRFRTYLHAAARHFLIGQWRLRDAAKRGAALTVSDASALESFSDLSQSRPDTEFDRAWTCAVLRQALTDLETEMTVQNRSKLFEALKPWLSGDASHGDTSRVADELNTSETAIRVHLSRLRKRLRAHIERSVCATLAPGADPRQELAALLAAFQ